MINCSKTKNYLKEKARMTENCKISCGNCPLSVFNNGEKISCIRYETKYTDRAVEIVQKWSDEHPQKTILDDFKEKYPNAKISADEVTPDVCVEELGYNIQCNLGVDGMNCAKCWQTPLDEVIKK